MPAPPLESEPATVSSLRIIGPEPTTRSVVLRPRRRWEIIEPDVLPSLACRNRVRPQPRIARRCRDVLDDQLTGVLERRKNPAQAYVRGTRRVAAARMVERSARNEESGARRRRPR